MDIADVDRNQLSKDTGIKYPTICEWLNLRKYPRIDKIEMLANYFGVQKSDLIEDHDEAVSKTVQIPVLGSVPAGTPVEAVQDIISYEEIPEKWQRNGEYFALKISGSSMFPAICDGDIAIVKKTDEVKNGDTVIAMVNGYEATCKRYKKMGDSMMLLPNNQDLNLQTILFEQVIHFKMCNFVCNHPRTFSFQKLPRDLFVRLIDDVPEP